MGVFFLLWVLWICCSLLQRSTPTENLGWDLISGLKHTCEVLPPTCPFQLNISTFYLTLWRIIITFPSGHVLVLLPQRIIMWLEFCLFNFPPFSTSFTWNNSPLEVEWKSKCVNSGLVFLFFLISQHFKLVSFYICLKYRFTHMLS